MKQNSTNGTRESRDAQVRILGTERDNPEDGRIFVWTKMGWFERVKGQRGGVAFIPVAKSQDELRELISRDSSSFDLVPLDREYRIRVSNEFMEQGPSYWDSEVSSEETNEDDEYDEQQSHQHD